MIYLNKRKEIPCKSKIQNFRENEIPCLPSILIVYAGSGIKPVFVLFTFNAVCVSRVGTETGFCFFTFDAVCVSRVGTETGFLISSGQQSLSGIHSLNGVFYIAD